MFPRRSFYCGMTNVLVMGEASYAGHQEEKWLTYNHLHVKEVAAMS